MILILLIKMHAHLHFNSLDRKKYQEYQEKFWNTLYDLVKEKYKFSESTSIENMQTFVDTL